MDAQVGPGPGMERALRQVVRERRAQPLPELPRPARRRRAQGQDGHHLGGRAGRGAAADLRGAAEGGLPLRQRPQGPRREEGRPRRDLHADDPGGGGRDARLHAHRRHPQRRLRWLLGRGGAGPHERRRGQAHRHRRRRLPPGRRRPAEGQRRRRPRRLPDREARGRREADGAGRAHAGRARPVVARADGESVRGVRPGGARLRAPALHPLYERHHRQAQGCRPQHRRLSAAGRAHHEVRLRPEGRGRLLVHGRHRLGHGPQLRRVRPSLHRRDDPDVRGRPQPPRPRPLLVDRRAATRRRRPSAPSCAGATSGRSSTTSRACACSARWGSRSTPRRGCGTAA